ncbi:dual specificity phosphatase 12 [Angomonas deanei]|nr:dual specificity phosphatase 12 [Angomonas deanei]|eukprot:EPY29735.1 dual specificity phosphatase 12 [Angomonas deanei]
MDLQVEDAGEAPNTPIDHIYSCKSCRTVLFRESEIVPHNSDKSAAGNKNFRRMDRRQEGSEVQCTSYFLDPAVAAWVDEQQRVAEDSEVPPDTLYCFHCKTKLGTQSWVGTQCSCGAWVTPAFKVLSKVVDRLPVYREN